MMKLQGTVVTPDGVRANTVVTVVDDRITEVRPAGTSDSDASHHAWILPGFVDLHNHGGAGFGFPNADRAGCRAAARHHRAHGTTTLLASLVSAPGEQLVSQTSVLADLADEGEIDGIHMEGPFINHCRCGAQDPAAIIPGDPALFAKVARAGRGWLKSITFAPETDHAFELLEVCAEHGVVASLGHTDADFDVTLSVLERAERLGVPVTATHLFNAMPPVHHRAPGAAAAMIDAAATGRMVVELVADGVHLHDCTVDLVWDAVHPASAAFVTDAMAAAGTADGDYVLGDLRVTVASGVARLTTTDGSLGAIAGGTSRLLDQVQRHLRRGRDVAEVAALAATTGARVLGLSDRGSIAVGNRADVVCLGTDLELEQVLWRGAQLPAAARERS